MLDAPGSFEVEVDPCVYASLAEMAVQIPLVAELVEELAELAEVRADVVRRDRGVLPAFPRDLLSRHVRGRAQARAPHSPDLLLVLGVVVELHRRSVGPLVESLHERTRL